MDFVVLGSPHWDACVSAPTNLRTAPSLFLSFVCVCACATALPLQPGQGGSDDANDDDAKLTGHTDAVLFPPQFRHFAAPLGLFFHARTFSEDVQFSFILKGQGRGVLTREAVLSFITSLAQRQLTAPRESERVQRKQQCKWVNEWIDGC